ncbi:MAG: hypothetical protein K1X82_10540 [Bacteroidia bacterium]|nr:hypothetical protein [Bacteroidia bacterium]
MTKRRFFSICLLLPVVIGFTIGCTNHRKQWAAQVDSLSQKNLLMVKSVKDSALRNGLRTIKVESGSRLILLDRYQGSLPINAQVATILKYAKLHKEAQLIDDRLDALSSTLVTRTDALKNLRTDIESGAWKKENIQSFIAQEKSNENKIQLELEKSMEKAFDVKAEFDSLHPFMVHYTDSILKRGI